VLLQECIDLLDVRPDGQYIDCTTGLGGHSRAILERLGPEGRLLCIDKDAEALSSARASLTRGVGRPVSFAHADHRELGAIAAEHGFHDVDGILMDLGVSSMQLGTADRGFSFGLEGPLDMRMDPSNEGPTAADIVNTLSESSLADLFWRYGEERRSRRLAKAVVAARPLQTTWDLARAAEQVAGNVRGRTLIHPATRAFLALRIVVNGELDSLTDVLPLARDLLSSGTPNRHGGRLVVIAFHSLEDRIVKQFFRESASECICPPRLPECRCGHTRTMKLVTSKAKRPSDEEVAKNPRARSAVLRAAERSA
jgi:16S rRNA (cytosine1402-N4)-methyltransferase